MDYIGRWLCRVPTPFGVQEFTLAIDEADGALRGEASGEETIALIDPHVLEGRLHWSQKVTRPMRLTIRFVVSRSGDRLEGTAKPGLLPRVKVEGTRVAEEAGPPSAAPIAVGRGHEGAAPDDRVRSRWPRLSVDTSSARDKPVEVAMFAFPGMTALDLIGPQAVLSGPCRVHLVARSREVVICDAGVAIVPDVGIADAPLDVDVLFVPGGPGQVEVIEDDVSLAYLADRGSRARFVTSACTGSLILGAAGLLRGYRATTHWAALDLLAAFGAEPVAERVVVDRGRITGGGVTAGIDFGLVLLDVLFGSHVAKTTQLLMEYAPAPPHAAGTPMQAGDSIAAEALRILAPAAREMMAVLARRGIVEP